MDFFSESQGNSSESDLQNGGEMANANLIHEKYMQMKMRVNSQKDVLEDLRQNINELKSNISLVG